MLNFITGRAPSFNDEPATPVHQYFTGEHDELQGILGAAESAGLVKAVSMDVLNDPRFFGGNVLKYRLEAFAGLSVVSGLMASNAMSSLFSIDKRMPIFDDDEIHLSSLGCIQLFCFALLVVVLFQNILAMYVGLAQPYHVIRLMTAGPTGFDAAASYYLNRNITAWRHFAIKGMLASLSIYVFQMSLRLVVKFDRQTRVRTLEPGMTPIVSLWQGLIFCGTFQVVALALLWCHYSHFRIFAERYEVMTSHIRPLQGYMNTLMMPRAATSARPTGKSTTGWFGFLEV